MEALSNERYENTQETAPQKEISSGYVLAKRAQDIDLKELSLDTSALARGALLRNIVNPAVDAKWDEIKPLLDRYGGVAGSAQFAHCLFAYELYMHKRSDFEALDVQCRESTGKTVTLSEVWKYAHEYLKKYGIVFRSGWVEGERSDHIKAV